jgi:hypothetical protein
MIKRKERGKKGPLQGEAYVFRGPRSLGQVSFKKAGNKCWRPASLEKTYLTREVGREAEGIVAFLSVMTISIVAHAPVGAATSSSAPSPATGLPGMAHWVLHRAIA